MRTCAFFFFLLGIETAAYNQVVKGIVSDRENHSRIGFAYIYFNGTYIGTNSNKEGYFEIDISKYRSMPLTISALGYYSVTLSVEAYSKPLTVLLKPKLYELDEVIIRENNNERERKRNLNLFLDTFLGTTKNAKSCLITNLNDLLFVSHNDTLKAFSSNPILIDNQALGYKITYFLDEFVLDIKNESFSFSGNIIFRDDMTAGETKKLMFESRRKLTYLGSRMHFFRSLWSNDLDQANFILKNSAFEELSYKDIVAEEDSLTKYLTYPGEIGICYHSNLPNSFIVFLQEKANFDINGYFDPSSVSWQGEMSLKRIADWLPYEYELK
jgi:hypothetical protein